MTSIDDPSPQPLVSIVTTVYNGERFLQNAIDSIANQSYRNIEYIIVDAESIDSTPTIIKNNKKYIAKWICEKDNGIYDGMNKGISHSTGEIIGILNSDDFYHPHAIKEAVKNLSDNTSIKLVYGAMGLCSENGDCLRVYGSREKIPDLFFVPFYHPTCFVRREVYDMIGTFDRRFGVCADYDWMLRFKNNDLQYRYVNSLWTYFRSGGASDTQGIARRAEEYRARRNNNFSKTQALTATVINLLFSSASKVSTYLKSHIKSPHQASQKQT